MIELELAQEKAGMHPIATGTETVPLEHSMGKILSSDLYADRDVPPFPRATMDGYACRREDLPGPLEVLETLPAGKMPTMNLGPGQCSRIMTGGMVPVGASCVIMQEYVKAEGRGRIRFTAGETDANIDPRGQDLQKGELLLEKGTRLTPGHLGIIASTGLLEVEVSVSMQVGVLATGSELVEAGTTPEGAQIRNANSYHLAGQVHASGHRPVDLGIVEDDRALLAGKVSTATEQVDLLILTGGASVGELDLVPGVLQELGFRLEFDRVAIQPGKPVSFGHRDGKACFGLSGNPVSSFVQFELLVRPYLDTCSGALKINRRIGMHMEKEFRRKKAGRRFFLPVAFTGKGTCEPVSYHGSGHLHALDRAMGFAEIPAGQTVIDKGALVQVRLL